LHNFCKKFAVTGSKCKRKLKISPLCFSEKKKVMWIWPLLGLCLLLVPEAAVEGGTKAEDDGNMMARILESWRSLRDEFLSAYFMPHHITQN
jgi:hypothetical protein